jgi:hypothetical protein
MTKGPDHYAERAALAFNRRDVASMLALVCFDSAVLMPSAEQQEG